MCYNCAAVKIDPEKKVLSFFEEGRLIRYKKREAIIRPFETPQGVYFLKKGYVRLYSLSQEGEEFTLIIYKPLDMFPMNWAILNQPHEYYVASATVAELYRVERQKFLAFIRGNPDVYDILTSRILMRFSGVLERMLYLAFGNAYQKIASILVICAERFGKKDQESIVVEIPLTHRDIAALVGLTRETASIELKKLERKRIITYHGRFIVVKGLGRLRKEALLDNSF